MTLSIKKDQILKAPKLAKQLDNVITPTMAGKLLKQWENSGLLSIYNGSKPIRYKAEKDLVITSEGTTVRIGERQ